MLHVAVTLDSERVSLSKCVYTGRRGASPRKIRCGLLLVSALTMGSVVNAASSFDQLPDLQGKVVVYAGEFEKMDCPIGGQYDCLSWPSGLLKTKGSPVLCLNVGETLSCTFGCRGLVAMGEDRTPFLYLFEQSMSSDLAKHAFQPYTCPSGGP